MMGRALDLTGQKFGRLVVTERLDKDKHGYFTWRCQCDCGCVTVVRGSRLTSGVTKSCGCLVTESITSINKTKKGGPHKRAKVHAGQRVGRLVVVEKAGYSITKHLLWLCECDCGNTKIVRGFNLSLGDTQSCGCLQIERTRSANLVGDTPCGLSIAPEYDVWQSMINRCTNPENPGWKNYGGRGITVCQRWQSFKSFYEDMCPRPEGLTLDRINNDDGYHCGHCGNCKEHGWVANCRWATWKEQANNRRRKHV